MYNFSHPLLVSGETTRKGFYAYDNKRKASPDPEIRKYIEKAREISGVQVDPKVSPFISRSLSSCIFIV